VDSLCSQVNPPQLITCPHKTDCFSITWFCKQWYGTLKKNTWLLMLKAAWIWLAIMGMSF